MFAPRRAVSFEKFATPRRPAFGFFRKPKKAELLTELVPSEKVDFSLLEGHYRAWNRYRRKNRHVYASENVNSGLDLIHKAFWYMREFHKGNLRKDGANPVEVHPFNVALYTAQTGGDANSIAAALLHDIVEDSTIDRPVSIGNIRKNFNDEVAELVSILSAPKVRMNAKNPSFSKEITLANGQTKLVHFVNPDHLEYSPKAMVPEDEVLEEDPAIKAFRRELQGERLSPSKPPISSLHRKAQVIKLHDATHNLQTLAGIGGADKQEAFVAKSVSLAGYESDKIHPCYRRSLPEDTLKLVEKHIEEGGYSVKPPDDWITYPLPHPQDITQRTMKYVPSATTETVNWHRIKTRHGLSETDHTFFVPTLFIGSGEQAFNQYARELFWHLGPDNDPLARRKIPKGPLGKNDYITRGTAIADDFPALEMFHPVELTLGDLLPKRQIIRRILLAQQQTLVRQSKRPLAELVDLYPSIANKAGGGLYWLPSTQDGRVLSLFLTHEEFGNNVRRLERRLKVFKKRSGGKIAAFSFEPPHVPAEGVKNTFNTVNIRLVSGKRDEVLNTLSAALKGEKKKS